MVNHIKSSTFHGNSNLLFMVIHLSWAICHNIHNIHSVHVCAEVWRRAARRGGRWSCWKLVDFPWLCKRLPAGICITGRLSVSSCHHNFIEFRMFVCFLSRNKWEDVFLRRTKWRRRDVVCQWGLQDRFCRTCDREMYVQEQSEIFNWWRYMALYHIRWHMFIIVYYLCMMILS